MLVDAALAYIEASPQWPIFPVGPTTKRPLIKTGIDHAEHASTDPEETIVRWLTKDFPDCSIAMPTGAASGTTVIDADAKHDGEALLAELESALGALPRTRVVRTQSGGLHLYFAHPGVVRVKSGAGPASPLGLLLGKRPGVDVRADGGIVVLPPSAGYRWLADDDELPPLPKLWLAAIQGAGEPPPAPRPTVARSPAETGVARATDAIADGARNDKLFRLGVALRHEGASEGAILQELERANVLRCSPPLNEREVRRIASSAARGRLS